MADPWLNYHHLHYFWTVARLGTIARAAQALHLGQPTISAQLRLLEESFGRPLFERQGRRLALTEFGRMVLRYAEEIFRLGNELKAVARRAPSDQPLALRVGVADVVPKLIAESLLRPALSLPTSVRLVCREGAVPALLGALALHELDVVLTDSPAAEEVRVKAFNHLLGKCGLTFFGARAHAGLRRHFPESLAGAPFLMPSAESALRRALDQWLSRREVQPLVVAEFDDSALLTTFGQGGLGVFAMPSAIERAIAGQFEVEVIGRTDEVEACFYAVSIERRLRHPAVAAIAERARSDLFG